MCAIAGLICLKHNCSEESHLRMVRKMGDCQFHRGPDDQGVISLGTVCLGSNRLSIIDLTKAGKMPMSDADGRWWIVYNGETYNFCEIRKELTDYGYQFQSKTDTEVVLHSFARWGDKSIERLAGMFAFAIYDKNTDTVTLVRDRFGKKPLYYTIQDGHFLFASEMKALMKVCDNLRPNHKRLIEWALFRNVDFGSPETLAEDILSLPPGHIMTISRGKIGQPRCYYSPELQVEKCLYDRFKQQSSQILQRDIEELISTSVKDRLISDVPLGTLCSGGIDSSLITALCAHYKKDVAAFHVSVDGYGDMDESLYAKQVTDKLGIELFTLPIRANAFQLNLTRAIYHSDAPLTHPNSIAFLMVSEFARNHGVKILLSGEAADELFGGYMQRYRRHRQYLRLQRILVRLPEKFRKALTFAGYACEGIPITAFSEYKGLLAHTTDFIDKFAREDLRIRCTDTYSFVFNKTDRAILGLMLSDLTNFLTPLLRRLDRMSMAASIECRVPFLDHRLVKKVINLPLSYKLHGSTDKWILKKIALHYLPRNIVYRKKVGFPLPLNDYLEPLARKELFHDGFCLNHLYLHRKGLMRAISNWRSNIHGFFNLLALEIWGRLFFQRQSLDDLTEQVLRLSHKTNHTQTSLHN